MSRESALLALVEKVQEKAKECENLRVQFYGVSASGKTTAALQLASNCKKTVGRVEYLPEYFKTLAFLQPHSPPSLGQQFEGFGKQLHLEEQLLSRGVKLLICDIGLMLCAWYTKTYQRVDVQSFIEAAQNMENRYPTMNVFLHPLPVDDVERKTGRWSLHSHDDQKARAAELKDFLDWHLVNPIEFEIF